MKKRTTSSTLKIIRLILITLIFLLPNKSLAIVSQTSEFYVNDYSQVLNEETKNYIINANYFTGYIVLGSSLCICSAISIATSLLLRNDKKEEVE